MGSRGDHFDGRRFVNPTGMTGQLWTAVPRMLAQRRTPWPARIDGPPQRPPSLGAASAVVSLIGRGTFLVQTAAGNLLTDPMYSQRASPLSAIGPRRVRQPALRFDDLPPISVVLLSHNHYDHCDVPTLRRLAQRFDPIVVTPLGNGALVRSTGIRRVEELDWWQSAATSPLPVALTPAQHFSARSPFDRNRALWGGFVCQPDRLRIYFAGDTAYAPFFNDVRQPPCPIAFALLPTCAYQPRLVLPALQHNPLGAGPGHTVLLS